jgi:hypothetical protein
MSTFVSKWHGWTAKSPKGVGGVTAKTVKKPFEGQKPSDMPPRVTAKTVKNPIPEDLATIPKCHEAIWVEWLPVGEWVCWKCRLLHACKEETL